MYCLICHFTLGIGMIVLLTYQKDKINLPQPEKYKILLIRTDLQNTQLNAHKKQPQNKNCAWLFTSDI